MRFLIAAISAAALLVSANVAKADKRVAFVSNLNAVAPAPGSGQQIGQMGT